MNNIASRNIRMLGLSAALLGGFAVAHAQNNPSPAPPPVDTSMPPPPSAPPVNSATPPVNTTPAPIGTPRNDGRPNANAQQNVARDANGNPLPATSATPGSTPAAPQPLEFGMLDIDKAGAIKLEQARNDPWLRRNFGHCDINHNDEVTKSEYEKCTGR